MTTIEEKIVSMGFDNASFEKHAAQSLATLDKLEGVLSTLGGKSGTLLADALESITSKFSVLGTIGDEVLRKLADGLVNVANQGLALAKSLSIDQINAGWQKYADKTQAVQTIMAATSKDWTDTGAQMEYVSGQLDKLNWFTDETSYSFLDMVNNIGKFTSNGIGLEESVTAMEGISTWAAISGANVQEAGRAMYNLSQALATGSVKLMDWKSIENANMATREFKETALETAVSLNTLTKSVDAEGNAIYKTAKGHEFAAEQFNTFLSDAWFTKDVLTSTLNQYGKYADVLNDISGKTGMTASAILQEVDAFMSAENETIGLTKVSKKLQPYIQQLASAEYDLGRRAFKAAQEAKTFKEALEATKDAVSTGWMNTFELIFGNYEEAKGLWTDLANGLWDVFASGGETRNQALRIWRELGDRARLFDSELGAIYKIGGDFLRLFEKLQGGLISIFAPDAIPIGDYEDAEVQLYLILKNITDNIVNFADAFDAFTNRIASTKTIERIIRAFRNIYLGIKIPLDNFKTAFHEAFDPVLRFPTEHPWAVTLANAIFKVSVKLMEFSKLFNSIMTNDYYVAAFQVMGKGFGSLGKILTDLIPIIFNNLAPITNSVSMFANNILLAIRNFAGLLTRVRATFEEVWDIDRIVNLASRSIATLIDIIDLGFVVISDFVETFIKNIRVFEPFFKTLIDGFDRAVTTFHDFLYETEDSWGWADIVNGAQEAFNRFFGFLASSDGQRLLTSLGNAIISVFSVAQMAINGVISLFKTIEPYIEKAFKTVLTDLTPVFEAITKFKDGLKESGALERVFSVLGTVFKAFASVAGIAYDILKAVFKIIGENIHVADGLGSKVLDLVERFSNWIIKLRESTDWGQKFYDTFSGVGGILEKVFDFFSKIVGYLTEHSPFEILLNGAKKAWEGLKKVFNYIKDAFTNLFSSDNGMGISPIAAAGEVGIVGLIFKKLFGKDEGIIGKLFGSNLKDLKKSLTDTLNSIGGAFESFSERMKGKKGDLAAQLRNIAISIGILALAIAIIANIDVEKIGVAFLAITTGLGEMIGVIKIMDALDLSGKQTAALLSVAGAMLAFGFALGEVAVAMVIFSAAVWVISKINPERLSSSILALVEGLAAMAAALFLLAKFCKGGNLLAAGTAILEVAAALDLLVAGVLVLSLMNPVKVSRALKELVAGLAAMTLAILLLAKTCNAGNLVAAGAAILLVAAALDLVALALAGLSLLDSDKLMASVIVLATMLAAIAVVLVVLGEVALPALGAAFALVIVGAALDLIAVSMVIAAQALDKVAEVLPKLAEGARSFENVKWEAIAKAGAVLAGVIVALFGLQFATILDGTPVLRSLGEAMPILANGFKSFEILNPEAIIRGGEALSKAIGALFKLQFSTLRDGTPELIKLGMAMPSIALGFKSFEILNPEAVSMGGDALAHAIRALFSLQFSTLIDGTGSLYNIGVTMPILAMGFRSFNDLDPDQLVSVGNALSHTIKSLFGLQFASFKDGTAQIANLGNSLPPLADGFKSFDGIEPSRIEDLCTSLEKGLSTLSGNVFKNLFKGDSDFSKIADGLSLLASAVKEIPENAETILTNLATGIQNAASSAVQEVEDLAKSILDTLEKLVKDSDTKTKEIVPNMTKAINRNRPQLASALSQITQTINLALTAINQALQVALTGMNTTITAELTSLPYLFSSAAESCVYAVSGSYWSLYNAGANMAISLANGIRENVYQVQQAAIALAESAELEAQAMRTQSYNVGTNVTQGLSQGMQSNQTQLKQISNQLAKRSVVGGISKALKINSPSKVMMEIGGYVMQGLANGIQNGGGEVEDTMITVINPVLAALSQLMDEDVEFSPKITPVVDMSNVNAMSGAINSMFSENPSYTVNAARRVSANERYSGGSFGNYSSVGDTINASINVYAQPGQDVNELAKVIERRLVRLNKQQQVGAF